MVTSLTTKPPDQGSKTRINISLAVLVLWHCSALKSFVCTPTHSRRNKNDERLMATYGFHCETVLMQQ